MVGGDGMARLVDAVEHREVHYPQKAVGALADRAPPHLEAQVAEHGACGAVLVGDHQDQVARSGAGGGQQADTLAVGEEPVER